MALINFESNLMIRILAAIIAITTPACASALNVFACEPEWAALIKELAPDDLDLVVATSAFQDPHNLQARPSLIAAVRNADMIICTGADLEIGWLPLLLRRAGNSKIQVGSAGHFLAADFVRKLEIPKTVDRSQGDIHPQGNPHIHLHPRNIERVAKALADRLGQIEPAKSEIYDSRADEFIIRWAAARETWEEQALPLAGLRLVSHHRSFSYLADWLNLDIVATLEPKPGIPASGAQLSKLLEQLTPHPPQGIIRAPFENEKPALWLSDRLDVVRIDLPYTVGGNDQAFDLFSLYAETIRMLLEITE
jgi:zinc/manganese transport system substrate-binding protein